MHRSCMFSTPPLLPPIYKPLEDWKMIKKPGPELVIYLTQKNIVNSLKLSFLLILFSLIFVASGLGSANAQSLPEPPFSDCDDMPRDTLEEKIEKRQCRVDEAQNGVDRNPGSVFWIEHLEKRQAGLDRLLEKLSDIPMVHPYFGLDPDNNEPVGITFLNNKFYISDQTDDKVYVYNSNGTRDEASDFDMQLPIIPYSSETMAALHFAGQPPQPHHIQHIQAWEISALDNKLYLIAVPGTTKYYINNGSLVVGSDPRYTKVLVYHPDGTRDEASDFDLQFRTSSMTAHDGKLWIVDNQQDNKVYAYNPDGTRDEASDFYLDSDLGVIGGITTLDGKLWSSCGGIDFKNHKVCAYNLDGTRDATYDFDLDPPRRIVYSAMTSFNGNLLFSSWGPGPVIYAYNPDVTRVTPEPVTPAPEPVTPEPVTPEPVTPEPVTPEPVTPEPVTPEPVTPEPVTPEPEDMMATHLETLATQMEAIETLIAQMKALETQLAALKTQMQATESAIADLNPESITYSDFDLDLDLGNSYPSGITTHDDKFWVVIGVDHTVYAYNASDGTRDSASDFDLDSGNGHPIGITFYDDKFWVVTGGEHTVYAYNADGTRDADSDFVQNLNGPDNVDSSGITAYDDKLWVVDQSWDGVFAYNASDGTLDSYFDSDDTSFPYGITFYDDKFWVVAAGDHTVYAYNASDGTRDSASDFDLDSDNSRPSGITAYDDRLWIVDSDDDKVYVYNTDGTKPSE